MTCVLGVFDGQKRAPSVCVVLNLVSGLGKNFLVNSTPGPAERFHIMGECTYLERINCPMIKMNPPKIGGNKSPLSPYAPPGRTLCYVVLCTIYYTVHRSCSQLKFLRFKR